MGLVVFPDATPKGRPLSNSSGGSLEDPTGKAAPSTLSETLGAVARPNGDRHGFQAQRPCSGRLPGLGSCAPRPPRAPGQWPTSWETRLAETCLLAPSGPGGGAFQTPATALVSLLSLLSAMRIFASRGLKLCCWVPTASEGARVWRRPCTPRWTTEVQAPDEASSAAPFCRELARRPALPWDLGPPSAQRGESNGGGGAALPQKTVVGEKVASISYGPATT